VTLCDYLIWSTVTGTRPDDEVSLTHEFVIWDEIFTAYKFCCNWPSLTVIDNWSPDRNWKQWANLPESNSRSRPRTGTWFVIFHMNLSFPFVKFNTLCYLFCHPLFLEKPGLFNTCKKRLSRKLIHDPYIFFIIFLFTSTLYTVKRVFTFYLMVKDYKFYSGA